LLPTWSLGRFNVARVSGEGETIGDELKAVLFTDGTYYGPESIFTDFTYMISTVRSLPRDAQSSADKYDILAQQKPPPVFVYRAYHRGGCNELAPPALRICIEDAWLSRDPINNVEDAVCYITRASAR
jgi:hypothetical protein